jgi:hypothetical protein
VNRIVAALAALAAAAAVASPVALGVRQPSAAEKTAIRDAVTGFYSYWYYGVGRRAGIQVTRIRISTVDRHFAAADVRGPKAAGRPALQDRVLLWHALRRWVIVDAPSSEFIGCGVAPPAVNRDLFRGLGGC